MKPNRFGRMRHLIGAVLRTVSILALAGCATVAESRIDGQVPSSPAAQLRQQVPVKAPPQADAALVAQLSKGATASLAQLIDYALRTSPLTRASWADARAAAAVVGSKRAGYLPQVDVQGGWAYSHQVFSPTATFEYKDWNVSAQINWLLLDLGGRAADIDEAQALLAAANLNHDATVQDLILRVEQAYTQYQGAKALLAAAKVSVDEARTAYEAADERRKAGLATVADVLQAKTAFSQAQLNLQTSQGQVDILRGSVAIAVGVPVTAPLDTEELPQANVDQQLEQIDKLIEQAERDRPDLARARAQAIAAREHASSVRSKGLPQLLLNATGGVLQFIAPGYPMGNSYTASIFIRWPLFTGFRDSFDLAQANEQADAAEARAESVEQQAILSVWTSYQAARTAVQRVKTARDLLASAQQSAEVAQGRYKEGVGSILDTLTAQAALASARAQEVQARADWQLAVAALAHDTGALGENK